jgi:hypothetical protein
MLVNRLVPIAVLAMGVIVAAGLFVDTSSSEVSRVPVIDLDAPSETALPSPATPAASPPVEVVPPPLEVLPLPTEPVPPPPIDDEGSPIDPDDDSAGDQQDSDGNHDG